MILYKPEWGSYLQTNSIALLHYSMANLYHKTMFIKDYLSKLTASPKTLYRCESIA